MFVVISTSILSHLEFQLKVVRFNLRRSLKGYECESVEISTWYRLRFPTGHKKNKAYILTLIRTRATNISPLQKFRDADWLNGKSIKAKQCRKLGAKSWNCERKVDSQYLLYYWRVTTWFLSCNLEWTSTRKFFKLLVLIPSLSENLR